MTSLRILVVEDDPYMVKQLRRQLKELGHQVIGVAGSVAHASSILSTTQHFDLAILDIELSDHHEGGIVIGKLLAKIKPSIPIIFYSNYLDNRDLIQKAVTSSPSAILSKESSSVELAVNIDNIVFKLQKRDRHWFSPKSEGYYKKINYKDIYWIRSSNKKIYITTNDEDDISYNITLSKFEEEHMKSFFLRIHQGWIINFHKKFDLDLFEQKVIFKGKESVLVPFTKNYLGALKQKMNISKTRKPFTK